MEIVNSTLSVLAPSSNKVASASRPFRVEKLEAGSEETTRRNAAAFD
jgi:hypothetical protein